MKKGRNGKDSEKRIAKEVFILSLEGIQSIKRKIRKESEERIAKKVFGRKGQRGKNSKERFVLATE